MILGESPRYTADSFQILKLLYAMMKHLCRGLVLSLAALIPCVHADSWSYPPTRTHSTLEFGAVQIVSTIDATRNQQWPEFMVRVFQDEELHGQYKGIAFEQLFASPDNSIFVGLSNDGVPGTAIVVFGAEGNLHFFLSHRNAELNYCDRSVTRVRVWYDAENPNVTFRSTGTKESPSGISVRSCHGEQIDLWETAARAYNTALEATR